MDIQTIRNDISNFGTKLFLNSAGASLMPKSVVQAVIDYLHEEEAIGGYGLADRSTDRIGEFYSCVAKMINSQSLNIAFTHDATDAYLKALSSIDFQPGDVIITSDDDYSSNHIQFISLRKRYGIEIRRIRNLENGDLNISHFETLVQDQHPKLVAITHIPTNSGMIQDVQSIGRICKAQGILYLVDACQSIGQIRVDVSQIQCDFLSATGRKFLRGPRGTGFLYVSDRILEIGMHPLFIDGKGAVWIEEDQFEPLPSAIRFETWERPMAMKIGMIEAVKYMESVGIDQITNYNQELMSRLRDNLDNCSGVEQFDKGSRKCNLLTFRKKEVSLERTVQELDKHKVFYSESHLNWGLLDYRKKGIDWAIRLSPHYFNTLEEMDRMAEIIDAM